MAQSHPMGDGRPDVNPYTEKQIPTVLEVPHEY